MARRPSKENELRCGRLGQNAPYGVVDMCGEPLHHDRSTGPRTPHRGIHHGMVWETPYSDTPHATRAEREKIRIIDPGDVMGAAQRGDLEPPGARGLGRHAPTPGETAPRHTPHSGRRLTA